MATPISTASPYQLSKCLATRTAKTNNKVTSGTERACITKSQTSRLRKTNNKVTSGTETTCINKIHTSRTERMAAVDLSTEDYYAQQARVWKFRSEVIFSILFNIKLFHTKTNWVQKAILSTNVIIRKLF